MSKRAKIEIVKCGRGFNFHIDTISPIKLNIKNNIPYTNLITVKREAIEVVKALGETKWIVTGEGEKS